MNPGKAGLRSSSNRLVEMFYLGKDPSPINLFAFHAQLVGKRAKTTAMGSTSFTGIARLQAVLSGYLPPVYLAPALAHSSVHTSMPRARSNSCFFPPSKIRPFSTTPSPQKRAVHREKNKSRGVSAIRRTGPRVPLPIAKYELPRPVLDPPARKEFKTNPNHGLWGFFNADKTAMLSPEEELAHGRSWTYAELNYKSFEDLHALYWVCLKERNRIATAQKERHRVFAGYGDYEALSRNDAVSFTYSECVLPFT